MIHTPITHHPIHNKTSSKFLSLFIFSLFSIIFTQASCQSCNNTCQKSKLGCNLCYKNCTGNPNNIIQFVSCSYRANDFNEPQCLNLCCSDNSDITINANNINKCIEPKSQQKQKQSWLKTIGYYAIVVVGSLSSFILLVILVRQVYKRLSVHRNPRIQRRVMPENYQHSLVHIQENSMIGIGMGMGGGGGSVIQNQNFPENCQKIIKDQTNTCCICLDGKVNTVTKCGHSFHIQCLAAWGDRKNSCPLCNSKNIYQAKLFCTQCAHQMKTVDLRTLGEFHIENLKRMKCQVCNK